MNSPIETPKNAPPQRARLHPLIATAAVALIIASLVAVAAITGVLPGASSQSSGARSAPTEQVAEANSGAAPQHGDSAAPAEPAPATTAQQNVPAAPAQQPQQTQQQAQQPAPQPAPVAPQPAAQVPQPPAAAQQYAQAPAPAPSVQRAPPRQPAQPSYCAACGTVTSIEAVKVEGHGTGIGAVGGAVAGGLVGNQFGRGSGRTAMTVLGVVGGAFGGNEVEKKVRSSTNYRVYVRTEDGRTRYFTYEQEPPYRTGDRVRVENGALVGG